MAEAIFRYLSSVFHELSRLCCKHRGKSYERIIDGVTYTSCGNCHYLIKKTQK